MTDSGLPLVLDLFSGTGSATQPFVECGRHRVVHIDIAPPAEIRCDVLKLPSWVLDERPQFVWASPPCTAFSKARARWGYPEKETETALELVKAALAICSQSNGYWILENPRGRLRRYIGPPRETVFYCRYGSGYRKETDLWGNYPHPFRIPCHHHHHTHRVTSSNGDGGRNGWEAQKRRYRLTRASSNPRIRAMIPRGLAEAVHRAVCEP